MTTYHVSDIDNKKIINEILSKEPSNINSIVIKLDNLNTSSLFDKLITLLKDSIKYFSLNNDDNNYLTSVSDEQLSKINKYFHSFGININYKLISLINLEKYEKFITDCDVKTLDFTNDNNEIELIDILDYRYIQSNKLEDRRFRLIKKDMVYIIWFNYFT